MSEKPRNIETGPVQVARCVIDLGVLAVKELAYTISNAIDTAWPDDEPEDAAVQSERWSTD